MESKEQNRSRMSGSLDSKVGFKRRLSFHRLMSFDERLIRAARERRLE